MGCRVGYPDKTTPENGDRMKIERDKLYRARNGTVYKVVCIDRHGIRPIMGYALTFECSVAWFTDGKLYDDRESDVDLIAEVREPREWVLDTTPENRLFIQYGPRFPLGEAVRVREILDETP